VMYSLIEADRAGLLENEQLVRSRERLKRTFGQ